MTHLILFAAFAGMRLLFAPATIHHSNGSSADVQRIHNDLANDGDTITLPAGTFTWTTQVRVEKNITFQGAGMTSTVIIDDIPKPTGSETNAPLLFDVSGNTRITGFTIKGQAQEAANFNKGTLIIHGVTHSLRIDHLKFDQPGSGAINIAGDIWGVIDHCDFYEPNNKNGVHYDSGGFGDEGWETPTRLGSGEGIVIEDCNFTGGGGGGATAMNPRAGARITFRHNTLRNQNTGGHGTEGARYRGMRQYEIYQNDFLNDNGVNDKCIQLRGGTGVIWGNTAGGGGGTTGYKNFVVGLNFRSFTNYTTNFKKCDGSNPWDQNSDPTGYGALDQVGRGQTLDQIRGNPPINQRTGDAAWPRNQLDPVYVWSNTWTPVPNNPGQYILSAGPSPCIVVGRDIIDNGDSPKPGYTPYTYPHPLVSGGGTSPTPAPTPTPTATETPTPTSTPAPTATATATPPATPLPTPSPISPSPSPSNSPTPTPILISLWGWGERIRGDQVVYLNWSGSLANGMNVYRDGELVAWVVNDGEYTDVSGGHGQESYVYQVCEQNSQNCSNNVTISF